MIVEVSAKNVLIEFFCQTLQVKSNAPFVALTFSLFITAVPFIWRHYLGKLMWENDGQRNLELMLMLPKIAYNFLSVMMLQLIVQVVYKKMHLKQMWMRMVE